MASDCGGRKRAWNSAWPSPWNGRAHTVPAPAIATGASSLPGSRATVTTADAPNGITKRQLSVPSSATVKGSDAVGFHPGPVPKKSTSGARTVSTPSNAMLSTVPRRRAGSRSDVVKRRLVMAPPPGGASRRVTASCPGRRAVGGMVTARSIPSRGAGTSSRSAAATRATAGAARASSSDE